MSDDADAYTIEEFCKRHRISIQLFYKFKNEMPTTFNVGTSVRVSREAAARWRAERERLSYATNIQTSSLSGSRSPRDRSQSHDLEKLDHEARLPARAIDGPEHAHLERTGSSGLARQSPVSAEEDSSSSQARPSTQMDAESPDMKSDYKLSPALELMRIISLREAAKISGLSAESWRRNHSDKIIRLSPRRLGVRLRDALNLR